MPQSPMKSASDEIRDRAAEIADGTREAIAAKAQDEARSLRDAAADEAQTAAEAAGAAAARFDDDSVQAQAIGEIAARLEGLARDIRGTDIDRLARTVRRSAQRNPLLFCAGAALAGFALTRFMIARDPQPRRHDDDDPWSPGRAADRRNGGA